MSHTPARALAAATLATMVLASACASEDLSPTSASIAICADVRGEQCEAPLDLGAFRVGESHGAEVYILNMATGLLRPTTATIVSGTGITIGAVPDSVSPATGEPLPLTVEPTDGQNEVTIAIESNDPAAPRYETVIHYEGVAPVLVVCPTTGFTAVPDRCTDDLSIEVGEIPPTQVGDVTVQVRNAGTTTLLIGDVGKLDTSTHQEFTILTSTSPGRLDPGAQSAMIIRYQPVNASRPEACDAHHGNETGCAAETGCIYDTSAGTCGLDIDPQNPVLSTLDQFVITLLPDDGTTPPAYVRLTGITPHNDPPIAAAFETVTGTTSVSGEVGQALWFDGSGSYDPEGDPLVFAWSIAAAPFGSAATPETPLANGTRFVPDKLGSYTLQLQVADALGQVDFVDLNLSIEPRYLLTVALSWNTNAGDVDLHVIPAGSSLFGADDCYYRYFDPAVSAEGPDWGAAGDTIDDPVLLGDFATGDGTERMVLRRPAAGDYEVWIHYFDDNGGRTADITIDVATDDASMPIGSTTATLTQTCDALLAGTVSWPAATFTPATAAPIAVDPFGTGTYCP